jgi:hypothetical protein
LTTWNGLKRRLAPAVDSGVAAGAPALDMDGNPRPRGAEVDLGAYELETGPCQGQHFVRGDSNASGAVDLSDAVFVLGYLFQGAREPTCLDAADANDDGAVDVTDPVYTLLFLFLAGQPIAGPYPTCDADPTMDSLSCEAFLFCR